MGPVRAEGPFARAEDNAEHHAETEREIRDEEGWDRPEEAGVSHADQGAEGTEGLPDPIAEAHRLGVDIEKYHEG